MNNNGEIKYNHFNVSAIINIDKAKDFSNDKKQGENLVNHMTQIGSIGYSAPEIYNNLFNPMYDEKIDVYSLGKTFCSLAFFKMEPPKNEQEINKYGISKKLIEIILYMIEPNETLRKTEQEIYDEFINFYVEKYVNNTSFNSCILSLLSSPSINEYLFKNIIGIDCPITQKMKEILMKLYNKSSEKKSINILIYEFRKLFAKYMIDFKEKENDEISPIHIIHFLINKMHEELNINKNDLGALKSVYRKFIEHQNPKICSYESYKKFFTSNFNSIISNEFFGLIKTKEICRKCGNFTYSFKALNYIPFNIQILLENNNKSNLNLYDAFDCLNKNFIELKQDQHIICENCGIITNHNQFKQFYNLSNNLVIVFDRGVNNEYKQFVNFEENFILNYNHIENFNNLTVNYKLLSVISLLERLDPITKKLDVKFIPFFRQKDNAYFCPLFIQQNKIYTLKEIKTIGVVIALFYYSDSGMPNFKDDLNNDINIQNSNGFKPKFLVNINIDILNDSKKNIQNDNGNDNINHININMNNINKNIIINNDKMNNNINNNSDSRESLNNKNSNIDMSGDNYEKAHTINEISQPSLNISNSSEQNKNKRPKSDCQVINTVKNINMINIKLSNIDLTNINNSNTIITNNNIFFDNSGHSFENIIKEMDKNINFISNSEDFSDKQN